MKCYNVCHSGERETTDIWYKVGPNKYSVEISDGVVTSITDFHCAKELFDTRLVHK